MSLGFSQDLFWVLVAALAGGLVVKLLKFQPLIGYILAGVAFGAIFPLQAGVSRLAEIGAILLLFSIGLELTPTRLARVFKVVVPGAILQIILVTLVSFIFLKGWGIPPVSALILSLGFSLSSTAVVVKILTERGEGESLHGEIMIGWLLVQDLAVIPMMVILPALGGGEMFLSAAGIALFKAALVVFISIFLGRLVAPALIHQIAGAGSRELLTLAAIAFALGTAALMSLLGISPALGAFLAGVVISESQENHAVFAETRPLRDLFVALFFITLGLQVAPQLILSHLGLIIGLTLTVLLIKFLTILLTTAAFGFRGKTAVAAGLGLAQVGEFAFVIFSQARVLNLITPEFASLGVAVALVSLIATPFLFKAVLPLWRKLRDVTSPLPFLNKLFIGSEKRATTYEGLENHIILCGYGRVGSWVGRALTAFAIPFLVVEYNQETVNKLKEGGIAVIYGDPTELEVLESAGIHKAKAIVLAIPDRAAQEILIGNVQTLAPEVKIISRAHQDEDWERFRALRVDKIVQPEFEGAIAIVRSILTSMGKDKKEIAESIKSLRVSRGMRT